MANEITFQIKLNVNKNSTVLQYGSKTFSYTMSGNLPADKIVAVTTSAAVVNIDAVGTGHWVFAQNLDVTNYCELGTGTGGSWAPFARMNAGEIAGPFRMSGSLVLTAQSHTNTTNVRFILIPA